MSRADSGKEAIRIVTAQSGRSFRAWKVSAWLTLTMLNMNIAESKGRSKYRWGFASLFTGPFTTVFLTLTKSQLNHPDSLIPREAAQIYSMEDHPVKATLFENVKQKNSDSAPAMPPSITPPKLPTSSTDQSSE